MSNRIYFYPDFRRYVLLTADALGHMNAYLQRQSDQLEAGGEIYSSSPDSRGLVITVATGPNPGDQRGYHSFNPDIKATTLHREQQYAQGRHAVGLWHTHPEECPSPSWRDRRTTKEYLKAFQNDRERYLMVILGNRGDPANIAVWSAERSGRSQWLELIEAKEVGANN